jgi:hypothetical protein
MALSEYYAYYEKDKKPHQLEKLKPGNIVNEFYLFQSSCRFSGIFLNFSDKSACIPWIPVFLTAQR